MPVGGLQTFLLFPKPPWAPDTVNGQPLCRKAPTWCLKMKRPDRHLCPFWLQPMQRPMQCNHCGENFEEAAILQWLADAGRPRPCHNCGNDLIAENLVPNRSLREEIQLWPNEAPQHTRSTRSIASQATPHEVEQASQATLDEIAQPAIAQKEGFFEGWWSAYYAGRLAISGPCDKDEALFVIITEEGYGNCVAYTYKDSAMARQNFDGWFVSRILFACQDGRVTKELESRGLCWAWNTIRDAAEAFQAL